MITILECGRLNSIQDLGRFGLRSIGVGTSGAMDSVALRAGNILVGNEEDAAAVEVQTFPFAVRFDADTRFALTGADAPARLGAIQLPPWWSMTARAGDELRIVHPNNGARVYLCVQGGLDVPPAMGSRSTNLRNGFGGLNGRELAKGNQIATNPSPVSSSQALGANVPAPLLSPGKVVSVRVVPGAELATLPGQLQNAFWSSEWTVTAQSDRAGYRLKGPALELPQPMEMRSYGVVAGTIQLPPSGQPIVQLSDANTAGGYPRLGGVIEADLHRLGQASAGTRVHFVRTDFSSAQAAQQEVDDFLSALRTAFAATCCIQA